jgi:hypothetical protein
MDGLHDPATAEICRQRRNVEDGAGGDEHPDEDRSRPVKSALHTVKAAHPASQTNS